MVDCPLNSVPSPRFPEPVFVLPCSTPLQGIAFLPAAEGWEKNNNNKSSQQTYAIVEGLDGAQETRLVILAGSVDGVGAHEAGNGGGNSSAVHAEGRGQGTTYWFWIGSEAEAFNK